MSKLAGSFWSQSYSDSHNMTSNIDSIMERPDFTLDDILAEDDVIQECKTMNIQLIEYLCTANVTKKLISMFINEPAPDAQEREKTKFPYIASEIFTCEAKNFADVFFEPNCEFLLDELFSFLNQAKPLHPTRAGYWRKVVTILCVLKYDELVSYLKKNPDILSKFLSHIDTNSVTEVLIAISWSNSIGTATSHDITWFAEQKLIENLVELMHPNNDNITHLNTSRVLSDLIIKSPINQTNPLLARLQNVELLETLMSYILSGSSSGLTHGLMIAINLLNRSLLAFSAQPPDDVSLLDPCISKPPIYSVTLSHLPTLTALLATPPSKTLQTQYGVLAPPLGEARFHLVELMQALFKAALPSTYTGIPPPASPADAQLALAAAQSASASASVTYELYLKALNDHDENLLTLYNDVPLFARLQAALLSEHCLGLILDLFFEYSFHSLLHGVVDKMVYPIIVEGTPEMQHELFINCNFLQRLQAAYTENDELLKKPRGIRRGHMGFLTRFCNAIHEIIKLDGDLACFKDDATWLSVEKFLNVENERSSILLGGEIPEMHCVGSTILDTEDQIFSNSGFDMDKERSNDPMSFVSQFLPSNYSYSSNNDFDLEENYDPSESYEYSNNNSSFGFQSDARANVSKPFDNRLGYWADFDDSKPNSMQEDDGFDPDFVQPYSFTQKQPVVFHAQNSQPAFEQNDEVMYEEEEDFEVHSGNRK